MKGYHLVMLAMFTLALGAGSLHAQQADLDTAISANFGTGGGAGVIAGFGAGGATPILVPATGLTLRQAIENVQSALNANWATFAITTNTFGGGIVINWGHNTAAIINPGAAGEIAVATGTAGAGGGAGGNASAISAFANCSCYAVGGNGSGPNGGGGSARRQAKPRTTAWLRLLVARGREREMPEQPQLILPAAARPVSAMPELMVGRRRAGQAASQMLPLTAMPTPPAAVAH